MPVLSITTSSGRSEDTQSASSRRSRLTAELPLLDARRAVGLLNQRTGRDLRLMNIQTDHAFVQRYQFHTASRRFRLKGGRWRVPALNVPEGDKSPTACLACALYRSNPGCESVRRVTLGAGSSRQKLSRPLPVTFHLQVSFIFRGGANHHDR